MYEIIFYTPSDKISPIQHFLNLCQPNLRTKILRQLTYVKEFGLTTAIPNSKKILNTILWELRILGKDNIRIICVNAKKNKVLVLHIFRKKTQKTPTKEINIALTRYETALDI